MGWRVTHPYVSEFRDRHGKTRAKFRRAGFSVSLPAIAEAGFAAAYQDALAKAPPTPIRTPKSVVGQFRTLIRERRWSEKGEYVYFVATKGMVKVGFSSMILDRLSKLSAQSPTPMRLLAAIPGGRDVERRYHEALAADRIKGEWFRLSGSVKAAIAAVKAGEHL
jgi:hypothetical protein